MKFCLCFWPNTDAQDTTIKDIEEQLHSVKISKIEIQSNSVPDAKYVNHLQHTLTNCNSILYVLDSNSAKCSSFLHHMAKIANQAKIRVYFIYLPDQLDTIKSELKTSLKISKEKISKHQVDAIGSKFRTTSPLETTILPGFFIPGYYPKTEIL